MKQIIGLFLVFVILVACRKDSDVKEDVLSVIKSTEEFSETSFLSKVYRMQIYDGKIYCMDKYQQQIFVLDKYLHVEDVIGEKGEGPYNFISLNGISISSKGVYILDAGNACVFLYTSTDSLKRIYDFSIDECFIMPEFKFLIENDTFFSIAASDDKKAFASFDFDGNNNFFWGERFLFELGVQNRIRNGKHLLNIDNCIISVSDNLPVLEIYDLFTKDKIEEFDYSYIPSVTKQLQNNNDNPHSYYVLCQDVCADKNNLYVLISEKEDNSFYTNLLLEFERKENFKLVRQLRLPGKVYSTFCVSNDTIYAYNIFDEKVEMLRCE